MSIYLTLRRPRGVFDTKIKDRVKELFKTYGIEHLAEDLVLYVFKENREQLEDLKEKNVYSAFKFP